ncbi:hypothetical protein SAMN04488126_108122 [Bhargavaea beijingensis]|uniref:YqgU-like 6-bladed beta-propeller domain-containing protein n=1 Tax=Bhargavaea beijingensis TaxID=426756 RepID=A0A1G7CU60_9BACL|nr:hypothetical protein SAMN04488126_108122 [Bhargavaea beijingensis]
MTGSLCGTNAAQAFLHKLNETGGVGLRKYGMLAVVLSITLSAAGCSPDEDAFRDQGKMAERAEEPGGSRQTSPDHAERPSVLGFDAEGRILAVTDGETGGSVLYAINPDKGTSEEVIRTELVITEAESHPSGRLLLRLDTGEGEARLRLVGDNTAENDLIVESHDIAWSWNPEEWTKLYITAFDENWEFEVFLADASTESLQSVEDAGPFPVWLEADGVAEIIDDGDLEDGGTLVDGNGTVLADNVLEFSSDGKMFAIAKAAGEGSIDYMIGSGNDDWLPVLNLPAEEQWLGLLPAEIEQAGPGRFVTLLPAETEDGSEASNWQPAVISARGIRKASVMVDSPVITCSPETSVCLSGAMREMLFDTADGTLVNWMDKLKGDSGE